MIVEERWLGGDLPGCRGKALDLASDGSRGTAAEFYNTTLDALVEMPFLQNDYIRWVIQVIQAFKTWK